MILNPYDPPQSALEITEVVPDTYCGPWRDGELLVVDICYPRNFPSQCVLTGVNVSPKDRRRMTVYYDNATISQTSILLSWPIARPALPGWRLCDFASWGAVLLGISLAFCYLAIGNAIDSDIPSSLGPPPPTALLFIGGGLAVFGFIVLHLCQWQPLHLHRRAGKFAWVNGVHPDFLKHLPPWPG